MNALLAATTDEASRRIHVITTIGLVAFGLLVVVLVVMVVRAVRAGERMQRALDPNAKKVWVRFSPTAEPVQFDNTPRVLQECREMGRRTGFLSINVDYPTKDLAWWREREAKS